MENLEAYINQCIFTVFVIVLNITEIPMEHLLMGEECLNPASIAIAGIVPLLLILSMNFFTNIRPDHIADAVQMFFLMHLGIVMWMVNILAKNDTLLQEVLDFWYNMC